jgi:hypothetical protein
VFKEKKKLHRRALLNFGLNINTNKTALTKINADRKLNAMTM